MLLFLHPRPASSHAGRAGSWSSFSSSWSRSPIEDAWLSGDCPGQGLSALPASRLEHRAHLAPTAEPLKAAETLHDLPIAALFQVRSCRSEVIVRLPSGQRKILSTESSGGFLGPSMKVPPVQKAEVPMVDPERTSPTVSSLSLRGATCVLIRIGSLPSWRSCRSCLRQRPLRPRRHYRCCRPRSRGERP
jgi:hypothetical protein